ncbi:Hypothetical predicted protein [Octopus vulgaris]|uniref:SCP domain-containing protein n=1 Tax=Octopus vulgaris TaxID=6645 RepID=A0AA36AI33_OCTVU|nr:Hypothetical predicted protein [Octopus vulgaris]
MRFNDLQRVKLQCRSKYNVKTCYKRIEANDYSLFFFAYGSDSDSLVNCTAYPDATMCLNDVSQDPIIPTEEDKEDILRLHNQYRGEVKPLAKQMYKMDWSDTMAELALKWARQCRFDHDTFNARIIRGYIGVGQNVLGANFKPSWNLTVSNWHSEIADYQYGKETDAMVGHYTQFNRKFSRCVISSPIRLWESKVLTWLKLDLTRNKVKMGKRISTDGIRKAIWYSQREDVNRADQDSTVFPYKLANATHQLTTCPRPANSTLCDCNGKSCQYGGMLDINTCQCNCYQLATGDECAELTCNPDYPFCEHYPETYCDVKKCKKVTIEQPLRMIMSDPDDENGESDYESNSDFESEESEDDVNITNDNKTSVNVGENENNSDSVDNHDPGGDVLLPVRGRGHGRCAGQVVRRVSQSLSDKTQWTSDTRVFTERQFNPKDTRQKSIPDSINNVSIPVDFFNLL